MSNTFTLAIAAPEPLFMEDPDTGAMYPIKRSSEFGLVEIQRFEAMQQGLNKKQAAIQKAVESRNEHQVRAAENLLMGLTGQMIRTLVPTAPITRLNTMGVLERLGFINWWNEENAPKARTASTLPARSMPMETDQESVSTLS